MFGEGNGGWISEIGCFILVFVIGFNLESLYSFECIGGSGSVVVEKMEFEEV